MKYTSGPWNKIEDKLTQQYYIACPYGETIFHIAHVTKEDVGHGISEEGYHANASLIAAAPELLESLKNVLHSLLYWLPRYGDTRIKDCEMVKRAKAAIAKAEGGIK